MLMPKILYLTVQNVNYVEKYKAQVQIWQDFGYECNYYNCQRSFKGLYGLLKIIKDYDIVYARHDFGFDYLWLALKFILQNTKLILEIPTPIDVYQREIKKYKQSKIKNI